VPSLPGSAAPSPPPASASGSLSAPEGAKSVAGIEIPPPPPPAANAGAKPGTVTGVFKVQIAATRDEPAAQKEWERLKHAHADLLGNLSPTVVRADLGDKGIFYRIQAGPVPDQAKAEKLCTDLKKLSIGCIVVKP
jgi:cell division septation protein DedD